MGTILDYAVLALLLWGMVSMVLWGTDYEDEEEE